MNIFSSLIAISVANAAPSSIDSYMQGWWLVTADPSFVTFALRRSVSGPPNARVVTVRTIANQTQAGVLQTASRIEINCNKRTSRYITRQFLDKLGKGVGALPKPTVHRPIVPRSNGEYLAQFVCDVGEDGLPPVGHITMLPIETVADQTFRIVGLGISAEAAAALAAADARRAPKAFNDLLNVMAPSERHPYIRAIKTPEQPAK